MAEYIARIEKDDLPKAEWLLQQVADESFPDERMRNSASNMLYRLKIAKSRGVDRLGRYEIYLMKREANLLDELCTVFPEGTEGEAGIKAIKRISLGK